jgi:hypothetical protein
LEIIMAEDINLFNPHDGLTGRDGGPYLDQEERRLAEIVRAAKEDREPDLESAPATAGTPLVTAGVLVAMANPASNPSQENADPYGLAVNSLAKDENFPVNAFSSRQTTEDEDRQKEAEENATDHLENPANPTLVSHDEGEDDPYESARNKSGDVDRTAPEDKDSVSSKAEVTDEEKAKQPAKETAASKSAAAKRAQQRR